MEHNTIEAYQQSLTQALLQGYMPEEDIDKALAELQWEILSYSGSFSLVYRSPCKKYALRVGYKYKYGMVDCQEYHACNAIFNEGNPYFPKIYWHVHSIHRNTDEDSISLTLMEVLTELKPKDDLSDYKIIMESIYNFEEIHLHNNVYKNIHLAKALFSISQILDEFEIDLDIGEYQKDNINDNILRRKNGEIVITDPYFLDTFDHEELGAF
ncbi:MAG: hypothetical protein ACI9TY_001282 [Alphaproteobacteria bacterium]|jgi:hypothetical protein